MDTERKLLGKVIIKGTLKLKTGLHIGASKETMKIGGVDSPVVRDPVTNFPYIPGSSLKGKMRSLLERSMEGETFKLNDGNSETILFKKVSDNLKRHECEGDEKENKKARNCPICRVFGSSYKTNFPARIIVRDIHLTEDGRKRLSEIDTGLQYTEWKFENTIDRVTSQASPRQIERIPAGSEFEFEIIYNIEDMSQVDEDLKNIEKCLELLQDDYLGGSGSRGYGKIEISNKNFLVKKMDYYLKGNENAKEEKNKIEDVINFIKGNNGTKDNQTEV